MYRRRIDVNSTNNLTSESDLKHTQHARLCIMVLQLIVVKLYKIVGPRNTVLQVHTQSAHNPTRRFYFFFFLVWGDRVID